MPHQRRQFFNPLVIFSGLLCLLLAFTLSLTPRRAAGQSHCPVPTPTPAECDGDGDGFSNGSCGGSDCDDGDASVYPGAPVSCYGEGNDNNCNYVDDYTEGACGGSPVLIDVEGDGIELTDVAGGVLFDLNGDGAREQRSWTRPDSDDAWLALDRDGNEQIDNGGELFGNFTRQPASREPNGYLALAEYDKPNQGGNGDGVVDASDAVFNWLRLWQDVNHNGISEPSEMRGMVQSNIAVLHLAYKESKRTDEHGNEFRYRAKIDKVDGGRLARWSWDVFLLSTP
ncbi:MAG TPA: putative metal-binding motif-containing protein [Pyrinomonadaceae bacterium]|nr:putative metal-binding motif-containing protein [Pyrinomonadaceae bacterium]